MKSALLLAACAATLSAQANPVTDTVMTRYKAIRLSLIDSAKVMPEGDYRFRLTPAQRTFAEWVTHAALGNYTYCSIVKGEPMPDMHHLHEVTDKSELIKVIQESFDYCDQALSGMTDEKALRPLKIGERTVYPAQGMINLVASDNEHYGNMVGYMRSRGIVPPSTARTQKK